MKTTWLLDKESFDGLLTWLDADREHAAAKYECIRRSLIKIFTSRGCSDAEELTDETFNRVARKVGDIAPTYVGEPALYFYGVAHNVHLEYLRKKSRQIPQIPPTQNLPVQNEDAEPEYECLESCMQQLPPGSRKLVLQYYQEEKQAKINHRKQLAEQLGIALNALRIKAYRIRAILQRCVQDCVMQKSM
jgi:RNA polymerase sigma factor (sigma-70 family)